MKKFNTWISENNESKQNDNSLQEFFWNKKPQNDPTKFDQTKLNIISGRAQEAAKIVANIARLPVYKTDVNLKKLINNLHQELQSVLQHSNS